MRWATSRPPFTFVTGAMANDHPDIVHSFLDAFRKADATWDRAFIDAKGNRRDQPEAEKMIGIVATTLNLPPDAIAKGIGYFDPEARLKLADLQDLLDWLYQRGMIKTKMDAPSLVDSRFVSIRP